MFMKSYFLIFIVLLGNTFGAPNVSNQPSKQDKDDDSRIVGGKKVEDASKYPFICSLQKDYGEGNKGKKFCAGTIIDRKWLVTAAHCTNDFVEEGNVDVLRVLCGTIQAANYDGPGVQYLKIKRVIQHPDYDPDETHQNDIALLELDGELRFTRNIYPACIAPPTHNPDGVMGTIMGWGAVDPRFLHDTVGSWDLLDGKGTGMNWKQCKGKYGWAMTEKQLCVTHPENHVCSGDSGGPYVQPVEAYKRECIVGIVSYGFPNCDTMPSVFTKISEYLPFIQENMKN